MKGKLILVLGGSRSGKSEFAEKIAGKLGGRVTYIATAAVNDSEMAERVRLHRTRRPEHWVTVEEEKDVAGVVRKGCEGEVFLLDCVTVWLTNLMLDSEQQDYIMEKVYQLADSVDNGANLILVSNEVGLGLVPEYPLGRLFRDLAGKANQALAAKADQVYFVVAGLPMEIKPDRNT
ncbi:bifunctional adenosylcobinamide kinase/adenosylcobinamide-phosphate guanylyltransferase [Pelotomaculum propionicicum]|uniref:Adenosylcobinamide kinase n=1 Tax=Pelotomaculum propionicicum TaxID=258475 RepID=A0A4Y7RWF1_9FIRM|nr:bifunctional adenosylcobinamide kinase/adenosylcobinamide-phosphate guanylyltransferase [Pelotomaculum propionicicum]NLI12677.1 bifunctional adenosylcobinamide kinase/adenosylcobinamide-phosphate guanylyltransferase [Peptococcaceae bacterium]TEB12607.1 Bifunctional adenosylcobalamin biosynthesis protein CobP [Pelotomaculum propionicicum]